ncbi:hypothetical protein [Absidia glauca]|uniref:Uncharacterized protein n=1 Tax=Absidia glauca TaxID=4829 RepID=A0A168RVL6_ABSGL|nr:hypothetical protein [Absidia glauca]
MNKLLQTPPLKVLGHAGIGKIRQYKHEPLVPDHWSKQTRLDIHMHYHFGQLELVLTKWEKMKFVGLELDPLTKKLGDQANAITDTIRLSWASYDIKDESEMKEYIVRSGIEMLYPRAAHYSMAIEKKEGTSIQLHYHHMASLGQVLATCDCILTSLQNPDRLQIAHLLAFLYQCLNMPPQQQPPMADFRSRIEQRFDEIKNSPTPTMDQDQIEWVQTLASDTQTYVLCHSTKDHRYQPLRGCSNVFDVMKQSTARPHITSPPITYV